MSDKTQAVLQILVGLVDIFSGGQLRVNAAGKIVGCDTDAIMDTCDSLEKMIERATQQNAAMCDTMQRFPGTMQSSAGRKAFSHLGLLSDEMSANNFQAKQLKYGVWEGCTTLKKTTSDVGNSVGTGNVKVGEDLMSWPWGFLKAALTALLEVVKALRILNSHQENLNGIAGTMDQSSAQLGTSNPYGLPVGYGTGQPQTLPATGYPPLTDPNSAYAQQQYAQQQYAQQVAAQQQAAAQLAQQGLPPQYPYNQAGQYPPQSLNPTVLGSGFGPGGSWNPSGTGDLAAAGTAGDHATFTISSNGDVKVDVPAKELDHDLKIDWKIGDKTGHLDIDAV